MLRKVVVGLGLLVGSILAAWGASSTLSGLQPGGPITNTDLFYDVQVPGTGGVKVTAAQFLSYVFGNVSGNCQSTGGGVFTCSSNSTGTVGIGAGTNITTSGATSNVTINVVATPTFSSITTTLASITGWLTAAGVNMQTASVAGNLTGTTAAFPGFLTASGVNLNTATVVSLGLSTQCVQSVAGVLTGTGSSCGSGQFSIVSGSNISTSGTANNITVNVIATPTFSSITTTIASITGWLTAAGVNMQTASVAGNLTGTTGAFTGFLTASGVSHQTATVAGNLTATTSAFPGFLTASGANLNTATIVSLGASTQCVESIAGVLTGTGSTCGTGQFSIANGTNITTSGTANNITVSVVPSPTVGALTVSTIAAVSGWLTSAGANFESITIAGAIVSKVRSATATTASATTDYFLCLDPTNSIITLTLPASPLTGLTYLVKDCTGQAAVHNIIVTGTNANIDGNGSFTMSTNYQSIGLTYSGTQWSVN